MLTKIEHIGIAVSNLEEANKTYETLLGVAPYKAEDVEIKISSYFEKQLKAQEKEMKKKEVKQKKVA